MWVINNSSYSSWHIHSHFVFSVCQFLRMSSAKKCKLLALHGHCLFTVRTKGSLPSHPVGDDGTWFHNPQSLLANLARCSIMKIHTWWCPPQLYMFFYQPHLHPFAIILCYIYIPLWIQVPSQDVLEVWSWGSPGATASEVGGVVPTFLIMYEHKGGGVVHFWPKMYEH